MRSPIAIGGIILCGGQSTRMGRSKAILPFGNETMLQRVARLLAEVVRPIAVVAAPEQELPALPADLVIAQDEEKGRGPLQGLAAGLAALSGKAEAAYVSSCDVPLLRPGFVRRMIELLGDHDIVVPKVGGYHHPLAAVYRLTVGGAVQRLLNENRLRTAFLFEMMRTRVVEEAELVAVDPELASLRNLNTPEDYQAALAACGLANGDRTSGQAARGSGQLLD